MTASQARESDRRARRLSTGHDKARSDIKLSSQIARQFAAFGAICRSFVSRLTVAQLVASARSQSARSPAALKSP